MNHRSTTRFLVEFLAGLVALGILAAVLLPALSRARESSRRASCQNNLKQMGLVLKMFANENKGERYPPLSPYRDNWMIDVTRIYPEYLTDLQVLVCPSSPFGHAAVFGRAGGEPDRMAPECVSSLFYIYTGYTMCSDEEALALFDYAGTSWPGENMQDLELEVPVLPASDRVRCGGQAGIPVLWDRVPLQTDEFAHTPPGVNVLHMDGHVEFVPYSHYHNSNFFPATRVGAETFGSIAPRMPAQCYDDW